MGVKKKNIINFIIPLVVVILLGYHFLKVGKGYYYLSRGSAYYNKGQYDQAIADYSKAIELDVNHLSAYHNRGLTHADLGDIERAIADLERALSLTDDPDLVAELEAAIEELRGR